MYTNHHHYGSLSHLKHPFLGGILILSLSLSSLYASTPLPSKPATPPSTTKTDANGSGINAKRNSTAVGVSGVNNTTVINKTIIINNYAPAKGGGHTAQKTKKTPPKKTITTAKTPTKAAVKTPPVTKTPTKVAVKTTDVTTTVTPQPKNNDCLVSHSKDYCNTTGKLLNKHSLP